MHNPNPGPTLTPSLTPNPNPNANPDCIQAEIQNVLNDLKSGGDDSPAKRRQAAENLDKEEEGLSDADAAKWAAEEARKARQAKKTARSPKPAAR